MTKKREPKNGTNPAAARTFYVCSCVLLACLVLSLNPRPGASRPTQQTTAEMPRTGDLKVNLRDGLKYVWISPGTFMMGCSPGDNECYFDEKPSHRVTISKGIWMGQTEVTAGAYKRFAAATGRPMPTSPTFNSGWAIDGMPIVRVTWDESLAYCQWIGGRLPSEAEWEYAARAGNTEARYGDLEGIAWYKQNSADRPHDVAQKRANDFGLYDTLGNVWEWVNDWYDTKYYRHSPARDPSGPKHGEVGILRGGSWYQFPRAVRVSFRYGHARAVREIGDGFRCVWEATAP